MKPKWTIETIPYYAKPIFWIYKYGIGIPFLCFLMFLRITTRVEVRGKENLASLKNSIKCVWHDRALAHFITALFDPLRAHAWLFHPQPYMLPSQVILNFIGVKKIIYGSTGNSGRAAADELATCLKTGMSTLITPDGPFGPKYVPKKGIFHIARQTHTPIVPIKIEVKPRWYWPSWDQKHMPIPILSKTTLTYGSPIWVTSDDFQEEIKQLEAALS